MSDIWWWWWPYFCYSGISTLQYIHLCTFLFWCVSVFIRLRWYHYCWYILFVHGIHRVSMVWINSADSNSCWWCIHILPFCYSGVVVHCYCWCYSVMIHSSLLFCCCYISFVSSSWYSVSVDGATLEPLLFCYILGTFVGIVDIHYILLHLTLCPLIHVTFIVSTLIFHWFILRYFIWCSLHVLDLLLFIFIIFWLMLFPVGIDDYILLLMRWFTLIHFIYSIVVGRVIVFIVGDYCCCCWAGTFYLIVVLFCIVVVELYPTFLLMPFHLFIAGWLRFSLPHLHCWVLRFPFILHCSCCSVVLEYICCCCWLLMETIFIVVVIRYSHCSRYISTVMMLPLLITFILLLTIHSVLFLVVITIVDAGILRVHWWALLQWRCRQTTRRRASTRDVGMRYCYSCDADWLFFLLYIAFLTF